MADNVDVTPGTGATIATDDVAGAQYQRVKVDLGGDGAASPLVRGQQTATNSLPVVLASDQGVVPVSDNSGSLTVDNAGTFAVQAAQSGTWTVQPGNTANTTAWKVDASSVAVPVTDNSGSLTVDYATTGSGTATGALRVELPTNGTGVIATVGTITNVVHVDDNSSTLSIDDGGGNISIDDGGNSITVDNAGTFAVQESGSALTSLQLIDDIVYTDDTSTHATGTSKGALFMAAATPTDTSVNANDIGAVAMTTDRKLHVSVQDSLPAGTNGIGKLTSNSGVTIGAVEIAASQTLSTVTTVSTVTTLSTLTGGGIAHDGADSGNPIKIGAKAITALSGTTLVSSADRTDAQSDLDGALLVRNGYCMGDVVNGKGTSTGTSVVSILSAPAASTFLYITDIVLANTGSTTSLVTIQYDTAGTPTDLFYCINPAGGGSNMHFDPPLKVPTAAKDVGFKPASSSTTQYCSMIGFKSKA